MQLTTSSSSNNTTFQSNINNSYNTYNVNTKCLIQDFRSQLDAFLFIFISLSAIFGNTIVFVCYYKYRPLRSITNVYILSLSASDLLVAMLTVPYTFVIFVCKLQPQLADNQLQSVFYMMCDMVPSILSIYALALVAIDRGIAISKPFWHRKYMNNKRASLTVVFMWLFVFGLVSFLFVFDPAEFTLFIIIMAYALPVIIMIFCYGLMGFVAKRHAKELSSLEKTRTRLRKEDSYGDSSPPYNGSRPLINNNIDDKRDLLQKQGSWLCSSMYRFSLAKIRTRSSSIVHGMRALKRELKAALTLSLILGCFIISWTPFIALNIEHYRCPHCPISFKMLEYFKMLHYTNSALNPVLFILLNKRWRSAFFTVIMRRKKNRGLSTASEMSTITVTTGW